MCVFGECVLVVWDVLVEIECLICCGVYDVVCV